ncbi:MULTISPECIES: hypothetical protein [unclassified Enterococcus]|uniref:hypothetical protein n=1 Tax=unclassified Enterococcus TaxID=2608891 RepID=UPI001A9B2F5A|nr:hypothetical protein [Enterococcus sp. DIV1271a]MBO1299359.1 hypothetical protein [Enterococcus sp. DIV1271a]
MKKIGLVSLFAVALLGACQAPRETTQETTNESVRTTETSTSKEEASTSNEEMSSSSTSSNETTASSAETSTSTQENSTQTAFEQLKKEHPGTPMPQDIPTASAHLNIAATMTKQGFSVLYYQSEQALPLNDASLNQAEPIASYLYQDGFASSQETLNTIQPFTIDTGGRQVDLGYNIVGYQQGAAGSSILEWQEGNWRLRIRASNIEGQDPVPLAKQIVTYLESARLPAPEKVGTIEINMTDGTSQNTRIIWQKPTTVYTITNQDSMNALKMAVSMEQQ